eukprot:UN07420
MRQGSGDLYTALGNTTCFVDFKDLNRLQVPTLTISQTQTRFGSVAAATPEAYEIFLSLYMNSTTAATMPRRFSALCEFDTSTLTQTRGRALDNFVDLLDPSSPSIPYLQPAMQSEHVLFVHNEACFMALNVLLIWKLVIV